MKPEDAEEYTQALGQVVAGGYRQIALAERLGVPKALKLSTRDWVNQRLGGYVKLGIDERKAAALELKAEGLGPRAIGRMLGVTHPTVIDDLASGRNLPDQTPKPESNGSASGRNLPDQTPEPIEVMTGLAATNEIRQQIEVKASREQREAVREQEREVNAAKVANVSDPRELLKYGRFSTILIDPPWDFDDEGDVNHFGRGKQNYASKTIDEILALPIDVLSDADCHLYLCITNRSLPKGFRLLDAWGFRSVTCVTWVKPSFGLGNYFRGQTEQILFGVKGSLPLKRKDAGTVFEAPRGQKHSEKPDELFALIESCSPSPFLEVFQRAERAGWKGWGEDYAG